MIWQVAFVHSCLRMQLFWLIACMREKPCLAIFPGTCSSSPLARSHRRGRCQSQPGERHATCAGRLPQQRGSPAPVAYTQSHPQGPAGTQPSPVDPRQPLVHSPCPPVSAQNAQPVTLLLGQPAKAQTEFKAMLGLRILARGTYPGMAAQIHVFGISQLGNNRINLCPVYNLPYQLHTEPIIKWLCGTFNCRPMTSKVGRSS